MTDFHEGQACLLEIAHGADAALDVACHVAHGPETGFGVRVIFGGLRAVVVHATAAVSTQRVAELVAQPT